MAEPTEFESHVPYWIERLFEDLSVQYAQGRYVHNDTFDGMFTFCILLEMDNLPRVEGRIIDPRLIRLEWHNGPKGITVECRARWIDLEFSGPGRSTVLSRLVTKESLSWVQKARQTLQWLYPIEANGATKLDMLREATRC